MGALTTFSALSERKFLACPFSVTQDFFLRALAKPGDIFEGHSGRLVLKHLF